MGAKSNDRHDTVKTMAQPLKPKKLLKRKLVPDKPLSDDEENVTKIKSYISSRQGWVPRNTNKSSFRPSAYKTCQPSTSSNPGTHEGNKIHKRPEPPKVPVVPRSTKPCHSQRRSSNSEAELGSLIKHVSKDRCHTKQKTRPACKQGKALKDTAISESLINRVSKSVDSSDFDCAKQMDSNGFAPCVEVENLEYTTAHSSDDSDQKVYENKENPIRQAKNSELEDEVIFVSSNFSGISSNYDLDPSVVFKQTNGTLPDYLLIVALGKLRADYGKPKLPRTEDVDEVVQTSHYCTMLRCQSSRRKGSTKTVYSSRKTPITHKECDMDIDRNQVFPSENCELAVSTISGDVPDTKKSETEVLVEPAVAVVESKDAQKTCDSENEEAYINTSSDAESVYTTPKHKDRTNLVKLEPKDEDDDIVFLMEVSRQGKKQFATLTNGREVAPQRPTCASSSIEDRSSSEDCRAVSMLQVTEDSPAVSLPQSTEDNRAVCLPRPANFVTPPFVAQPPWPMSGFIQPPQFGINSPVRNYSIPPPQPFTPRPTYYPNESRIAPYLQYQMNGGNSSCPWNGPFPPYQRGTIVPNFLPH